ncbi:MAG: hypothetical protein JSS87_09840 [Acidobacteria bacterium]|nr:hypothetical protein [Acidobacteriota bacterium]
MAAFAIHHRAARVGYVFSVLFVFWSRCIASHTIIRLAAVAKWEIDEPGDMGPSI